ncbi:TerB family tellurite resistance protein [Paracoccus sp. p4-l81]|uniref:TerB family tellurite resistance protein n=1 Tax=unclassified Paracoccus (in: a-proteobacteria) TaxID=2688777 RepID=UPI0035B80208
MTTTLPAPESIWSRLAGALAALGRGEGLSAVFDRLRTPPERSVGFTIAVIALGAKMAKADGRVTRDEVTAFRQVFTIPPGEEVNAARVFNLARADVAGFDYYARKIGAMFAPGDACEGVLEDVMEGLFFIALADGDYNEAEDAFLAEVARHFGLSDRCFRRLRASFVPEADPDPWHVLGLDDDAGLEAARARWRELVREAHPDRAFARGLPPEAVRLAEVRTQALNRAWEAIRAAAPQPVSAG